MLKTADYLQISNLVYHEDYRQRIEGSPTLKGYYLVRHSDSNPNTNFGYQGLALYNPAIKHLVFASSGSSLNKVGSDVFDFYQDLVNDKEILDHKTPAQFAFAQEFFQVVTKTLPNKQVDLAITFTGHSLGATISELLLAHAIKTSYKATAVTFDGPGSLPLIQKQWGDEIAKKVCANNIIHLGAPNIINTINKQAGKVFQLEYHGENSLLNVCSDKATAKVCSNTIYPSHKMDVFLSEVDYSTREFKSEKYIPNWNDITIRPEVFNLASQVPYINDLLSHKTFNTLDFATNAANLFLSALDSVSSDLDDLLEGSENIQPDYNDQYSNNKIFDWDF